MCLEATVRIGTFRLTDGAEEGLEMCEDVIYVTKENDLGQLLWCTGKLFVIWPLRHIAFNNFPLISYKIAKMKFEIWKC